MIENINHISFTISDLDASVDFYKNVLGLDLLDISDRDAAFSEKVTGIKGAKLRIAYMSTKNCCIELIQYTPPGKKIDTSTCNIGSPHVCFYVNDFKEFMKKLMENKVKIVNDPQLIPAGPNKGKYVVYTEDPDSNTLEFISVEKYENDL